MGDFQRKLANMKEKIKDKLLHPYVFQHIDTPVLDEDKLLLLVSILDQIKLPEKQFENYSMTTTLLQVALDTHDQVTNEKANRHNLRNRQLTVLAGVYYSGLYYKILADCSDVDTIRLLAQSIKTINDKKILVYQKDILDLDLLMKDITTIETSLILRYTDRYNVSYWNEFVANYLLIKRLKREKALFLANENSVIFDVLQTSIFAKQIKEDKRLTNEQQNYLVLVCDRYIELARNVLSIAWDKIPYTNELLTEKVQIMLRSSNAKTYVEEG